MTPRIYYLAVLALRFCTWPGAAWAQSPEPLPKLNYETIADFFQLPPEEHLVEPAGVAVNSKGHICVFNRGKRPLMEFDTTGNVRVPAPMVRPLTSLSLAECGFSQTFLVASRGFAPAAQILNVMVCKQLH